MSLLGFRAELRILGYISTLMSIYQNSDIYTKKFIALIKTIFSIVTKILIYFYNYILYHTNNN